MTLAEITARITFLTGASSGASGQYKDSDRLININKAYNEIQTLILSSQDESDFDDKNNTTFSSATTNIISGQKDYALPASCLTVRRVDVTYDGATWYKAIPFDAMETTEPLDTTSVLNNFESTTPYYDIRNNSIVLYPVPTQNVTAGLKIWTDRYVTEFTSSDMSAGTASPGFDRLFHDLIPLKVSYDWLLVKTNKAGEIDRLNNQIKEMEAALKEHYGKKQLDRQMTLAGGYSLSDFS